VQGIIDQFSKSYSAYTTLSPVLGTNMITYSKSPYIYHNKIMLVDALHPASDPQTFTGSFNWSSAAQTKNDENSIIIHDASIANQYYQSVCNDFFVLGGTSCTSPLPIDLLYFKGSVSGNNVQLQWACESTLTTNTYQLERSEDGINYSDLTERTIISNDNLVHHYTYTDTRNNLPIAYYRLKMIDNNSVTTYSNTIVINKQSTEHFSILVYPNPSKDILHINLPKGNSTLTIINSLGQTVRTHETKQLNYAEINVRSLTNGLYNLVVHNNSNIYHQSFIKD